MEGVGRFGEKSPVAGKWNVFDSLALKDGIFNYKNADSCGSYVLLGSGVDNVVLLPVDWLRAEVA